MVSGSALEACLRLCAIQIEVYFTVLSCGVCASVTLLYIITTVYCHRNTVVLLKLTTDEQKASCKFFLQITAVGACKS